MKKELRQELIPNVPCHYGAPMGRSNFWPVLSGPGLPRTREGDVRIPINSGGYDAGGAYWGTGSELRCKYRFELLGDQWVLTGREFYRGVRATRRAQS
jgi:hypothetical protein